MTNGQDRRVVAIIYSVMAREAGSMASSETALRHFAALACVPPQSLSARLGPTRLGSVSSEAVFLPPLLFFGFLVCLVVVAPPAPRARGLWQF